MEIEDTGPVAVDPEVWERLMANSLPPKIIVCSAPAGPNHFYQRFMEGKDMRETKDDSMILLGLDDCKADVDLFKDREAVNVPAHGPRKVKPYKPNRKQRRAQQAYNRKHKKDKP